MSEVKETGRSDIAYEPPIRDQSPYRDDISSRDYSRYQGDGSPLEHHSSYGDYSEYTEMSPYRELSPHKRYNTLCVCV